MNKMDTAIKYYIEYEAHNRLNNVKIPSDATGADYSILEDTDKLLGHVQNKKKKEIKKIFNYEMSEMNDAEILAFLEEVFKLAEMDTDSEKKAYLEKLIEKYKLISNSQIESRVERIIEIVEEKSITILSPIYVVGNKEISSVNGKEEPYEKLTDIEGEKLHLIGIKCFVEEKQIKVSEFKINQELLEKMMLKKKGYGIEEVLGGFESAQNFFLAMNETKFDTYHEAVKALTAVLIDTFPLIEAELSDQLKLIMISLDGLSDLYYPPFKDDMKLLLSLEKRKESHLLKKYINHNKNAKEASEIFLSSHEGSYNALFPVNDKQWKVICGVEQSEILAVSGPPGTGKTTLLKEIVADLSVKRVKSLIEVWDEEWQLCKYNNQVGVYCSPCRGDNYNSIVVASTNNDAVNNVGEEITKDIREMATKIGLRLNSSFSAKLGNTGNKKTFWEEDLILLTQSLDNYNEEIDVIEQIEEFREIEEKLEVANKCILNFLEEKKVFEASGFMIYEGNQLAVEKMNENKESLERVIKSLEIDINIQREKILSILKNANFKIDEQTACKEKEKETHLKIEDYQKEHKMWMERRSKILPRLCIKFLSVLGHCGQGIINRFYGDIETIESNIKGESNNLQQIKMGNQKLSEEIETLKKDLVISEQCIEAMKLEREETLKVLGSYMSFFDTYENLSKILGEDLLRFKDSNDYSLYNSKVIYESRHRLFQLSLIINEAYILKNRLEIKNNLNLMLNSSGKIIQSFYRDSYKYDTSSEKAIRQIWESFCMCYPVITTTLHSFSRDNFHMIDNLFDYLLIDEAGQILPYYLLAPLYRFRNAIVVGDEKQLEPIRDIKNKVFKKYSSILPQTLNANNTTAQGLANIASDYYEINKSVGNVVYEGIMLEEHRRCERSIVQFSNKYVYDNRMKVIKEDVKKAFLEDNVCFIDIRGIKDTEHKNRSEAKAVAHLVTKLLEIYKAEDIAVIAPYKNQVTLIKSELSNHLVKVGTVHSFQGKDMEVVIMSMTISSEKDFSAKRFIGYKANMLNVAFTRAKQQLFIIGNYSVLEQCENTNYLYKTASFIKEYGSLFSIYNAETLDKLTDEQYYNFIEWINEFSANRTTKFDKIFKPYLNKVNLLENQNHNQLLLSLFETAEKSISVVSPWITKSIIKKEFIEQVRLFKKKNKDYSIVFGYMKSKDTLDTEEEIRRIILRDHQFVNEENIESELRPFLALKKVMGGSLKYKPPLHSKVLLIDNEYLLMGSHNWLSKQGKKADAREEMTVIVQDRDMINYIREKFDI